MYKNKSKYNAYMRNWQKGDRLKKILALGGKCKECGEGYFGVLLLTKSKEVLCWNCKFGKKVDKVKKIKTKNHENKKNK